MKYIQGIFFTLGVIFLFATVAYFSYEYIFNLSDVLKTIVLVCLIIAFFISAEILEGKDI